MRYIRFHKNTYYNMGLYNCTESGDNSGEYVSSYDAEMMLTALEQIAAIENKLNGGDWDEIEQARSIAKDVLSTILKE